MNWSFCISANLCFHLSFFFPWQRGSIRRSSRAKVFCKKGVVKSLTKSTEKESQSLFFNKVAGLSLNFAKCLRTPFLTKHLSWLLLLGVICLVKSPSNVHIQRNTKCLKAQLSSIGSCFCALQMAEWGAFFLSKVTPRNHILYFNKVLKVYL